MDRRGFLGAAALTGISNRRYFLARGEQELRRAREDNLRKLRCYDLWMAHAAHPSRRLRCHRCRLGHGCGYCRRLGCGCRCRRLAAEPEAGGHRPALGGISRCGHRVVLGQPPALPVLSWGHAVMLGQMGLEQLHLPAVLEADDVVRHHRLPDRHRRRQGLGRRCRLGLRAQLAQGPEHAVDQPRQLARRQRVAAGIGGHDLGGQAQQFWRRARFVHTSIPELDVLGRRSGVQRGP